MTRTIPKLSHPEYKKQMDKKQQKKKPSPAQRQDEQNQPLQNTDGSADAFAETEQPRDEAAKDISDEQLDQLLDDE